MFLFKELEKVSDPDNKIVFVTCSISLSLKFLTVLKHNGSV